MPAGLRLQLMTYRRTIGLLNLLLGFPLLAPNLPSQETSSPAAATSSVQPATSSTQRPLLKIIVTESLDAAKTFVPAADSGFVVLSPGLSNFDAAELTRRMDGGEKRVIEERLLTG